MLALRFLTAVILASSASGAFAQCANAAKLSCSVYPACFEKYCPCEATADGYFLRYGKRYCDRFLVSEGWSEKGTKWRDSTLLCLQERIVPKLDISAKRSCDCKSMKAFAYQAHVDCYTRAGASVCGLETSDYMKLYEILDVASDLLADPYSRRQLKETFLRCVGERTTALATDSLDAIKKILKRLD